MTVFLWERYFRAVCHLQKLAQENNDLDALGVSNACMSAMLQVKQLWNAWLDADEKTLEGLGAALTDVYDRTPCPISKAAMYLRIRHADLGYYDFLLANDFDDLLPKSGLVSDCWKDVQQCLQKYAS